MEPCITMNSSIRMKTSIDMENFHMLPNNLFMPRLAKICRNVTISNWDRGPEGTPIRGPAPLPQRSHLRWEPAGKRQPEYSLPVAKTLKHLILRNIPHPLGFNYLHDYCQLYLSSLKSLNLLNEELLELPLRRHEAMLWEKFKAHLVLSG